MDGFGLAMTNPKLLTDGWWVCSHLYITAVHPHAQAVVQVCDEITENVNKAVG